jgi:hopanoid biosynthesis associated RND transporter like protein HpnN
MIARLLQRCVSVATRRAVFVVLAFILAAGGCGALTAVRLRVTTDLNALFSPSLPWKQRQDARRADFPQFVNLIVAVVDARIPEEAEAVAADLAAKLGPDTAHFTAVRRPDTSAYFDQEGLLFLSPAALQRTLDAVVDAAPFLGQMAQDPSARGLFSALTLVAEGVRRGQAIPGSFAPALGAFHAALGGALAGHAAPLSWEGLLAGPAAELAGPDRIVLLKPKLDFGAERPGGAATAAIRAVAAANPYVARGEAHVRLTGDVPIADEEFSSAAQGAVTGLALSFALVVVWLYLALATWRLILPVVGTLLIGLALTIGFAVVAVGTLNLISVAFAILFVGIAVDFAIQFTVRYREARHGLGGADAGVALVATAGTVGPQVLIAAVACAAGFLSFVPTNFRGVAELGLIAGGGMLIAFVCTVTFLPAALSSPRAGVERAEIGFARAAVLDRVIARRRRVILAVFAALGVAGCGLGTTIGFDSNTLHTKRAGSEAVSTLLRLQSNPVTNPFIGDVMRGSVQAAHALAPALSALPLVDHVVDVLSLVPADQAGKLAQVQDAAGILAPVLSTPAAGAAPSAGDLRAGAARAAASLEAVLGALPADSPLRPIAADLAALARAPDATVLAASDALTRFLPGQLARLRMALTARAVTLADVPAALQRDFVLPDGRARIQAVPRARVNQQNLLGQFVAQLRSVAPDAGGPAVEIEETARTISGAFDQAAISAVVAIAIILFAALRSVRDAGLVLAPLLLSAALTALCAAVAGMELNYANVIALPLLLGVGVSFNIYFVMNWRRGEAALLTSATTRAVVFSALTTGTAFGSLAVSAHPGTASMGTLLLLSLGCTLTTTLIFVPALLSKKDSSFSEEKEAKRL